MRATRAYGIIKPSHPVTDRHSRNTPVDLCRAKSPPRVRNCVRISSALFVIDRLLVISNSVMPEIASSKAKGPSAEQKLPETNGKGSASTLPDQAERNRKINELRKLIEGYDDCMRRSDDLFLCRFLYCCDWNVEESFARMVKLFKLKEANPEWFFHKPIATYRELLNRNIKFALDRRDRRGRRVFVTRLGAIDFSTMAITDLANLDDIWFELMLNEPETLDSGVTCLIDMSGYSLKGLRFLTPQNIRVGSAKADLLPLKNIEFHVVNSSVFMNAAVAILYPMLSKKIKESVHFHYSNWSSLHEYVPADILPQEYGGSAGKVFDYEAIVQQVMDRADEFDRLLTFGGKAIVPVTPSQVPSVTNGKVTKTKGKLKGVDKKKKGMKEVPVEE